MIGIYDYTVWLTYGSLLSAMLGILVCLHGVGHPFIGIFFLMICGLCDAFDGKVARHKKDRTKMAQAYGIQIDSLSDLVAFGVLPGCIGFAMIRVSPRFQEAPVLHGNGEEGMILYPILFGLIVLFYVLAALIRLAYFNVTEEERADKEGGVRKIYTGLPVTSASLIFPTVLLIQFATDRDTTILYFVALLVTGFLFISKIHIRKPALRGILTMIAIGVVEFGLLLFLWLYFRGR